MSLSASQPVRAKRVIILNILVLAGLYTVRVYADAFAAGTRVRGAKVATTDLLDLDNVAAYPALIDRGIIALGRVDLVLLAHGILPTSDACEASSDRTAQLLTTDFTAPVIPSQSAALRLAEIQETGTLAAICPVPGHRGCQSNYAYRAAKGGLASLLPASGTDFLAGVYTPSP